MVVKNRGVRTVHLAGVGLITLAIGAIQVASQNGFFSGTSKSTASVSTDLSNASNVDLNPWGQSLPASPAMPTAGEVLPPRGTFVSVESNPQYANSLNPGSPSDIQVYFSPKGGCTAAIVEELNRAQRQILIQAYSFTSEPIAAASVAAHNRGVQVCAVLDKSQETEQYSAADFLDNSGIPTLIDSQHAIAHNKVILIDGVTLITGSFNFTTNAEQANAENMLIIHNRPDLYAAYEKNFQHHLEHSQRYMGRGTTGKPAATRGTKRSTSR